jgi:transcription elongation factor Elf1
MATAPAKTTWTCPVCGEEFAVECAVTLQGAIARVQFADSAFADAWAHAWTHTEAGAVG